MTEVEYKALIGSYQQKAYELFSQVIALEARQSILNKTIEELNSQVNTLNSEVDNLKSKTTRKTTKSDNSSEEF
jgi:outer membrane murein-binding lipoprotein Lpp